jgi:hypothetical protein
MWSFFVLSLQYFEKVFLCDFVILFLFLFVFFFVAAFVSVFCIFMTYSTAYYYHY